MSGLSYLEYVTGSKLLQAQVNKLPVLPFSEFLSQIQSEYQMIGGECVRLQKSVGNHSQPLTLPLKWQIHKPNLSFDTYENRLLKQFLRQHLVTKLTAIEKGVAGEIQRCQLDLAFKQKHKFSDAKDVEEEIKALQRVIQDCQRMRQQC